MCRVSYGLFVGEFAFVTTFLSTAERVYQGSGRREVDQLKVDLRSQGQPSADRHAELPVGAKTMKV